MLRPFAMVAFLVSACTPSDTLVDTYPPRHPIYKFYRVGDPGKVRFREHAAALVVPCLFKWVAL